MRLDTSQGQLGKPGAHNLNWMTTLAFIPNLPVPRHQYQGEDGDVGRDVDDVLDRPAPGQTEGPEHEDVVTGRGRDTDQDEQEVRHGQVEDQQVGRVLHLGVPVDLGPGHSYRITLRATRETDRQREKYEMI